MILGNSGVGKSTIINRISSFSNQKTDSLSSKTGRGKQTTTFSEMFKIDNSSTIIDTPGFKDFNFFQIEKNDIKYLYPEFEKKFGKRIGGDIIEKKKTLLYIYTIKNLSKNQREEFEKVFYSDELSEELKISKIKTFYEDSGSVDYLKKKVKEYSNKASKNISQLEVDTNKNDQILNFSRNLLDRQI